ncbi:hypothetical protein SynPROS91_01456 [Synechococcus sp. PROS-9-1]|nr:hypothetical protein SynPROS91_01456 [Synechococcus sp. PROS-9-1]
MLLCIRLCSPQLSKDVNQAIFCLHSYFFAVICIFSDCWAVL